MASHGSSSPIVQDGSARERRHNTSVADLQTLVNNVRLDGPASTTTIDDIAQSIKMKLALNGEDDSMYRNLAALLIGCKVGDENQNQSGFVEKRQRKSPLPQQQQQPPGMAGTEHETCSSSSSTSPEARDSCTGSREIFTTRSRSPRDNHQNVIQTDEPECIRGRSPSRSNERERFRSPFRLFPGRRPPTPDRSRMPTADSQKHTTPLRSRDSPRNRSGSPFRRFFRQNSKSQEQERFVPVTAQAATRVPTTAAGAIPVPTAAASQAVPASSATVEPLQAQTNGKSVLQPSQFNINRLNDRPPSGRTVSAVPSCLPPSPVKPSVFPPSPVKASSTQAEPSSNVSPSVFGSTSFTVPPVASTIAETRASEEVLHQQKHHSPSVQGPFSQAEQEVQQNRHQNFREFSEPVIENRGNNAFSNEQRKPPLSRQLSDVNLVQTVSSESHSCGESSGKQSEMDDIGVTTSDEQEMSASSSGNVRSRSDPSLSFSFRRSRSLTPSSGRKGRQDVACASISPPRRRESASSAVDATFKMGVDQMHRASAPPISGFDHMHISPFPAKFMAQNHTEYDFGSKERKDSQRSSDVSNPPSDPVGGTTEQGNTPGFTNDTVENVFKVDLKPKKKNTLRTKRSGARRSGLPRTAVDGPGHPAFVPQYRSVDLNSSFDTGTEANNISADCSDSASDVSPMETDDDDSLSDLDVGGKNAIHYPSSAEVGEVQFAVGITGASHTPRRRRGTRGRSLRFEKSHRTNPLVPNKAEANEGADFGLAKADSTDQSFQSTSSSTCGVDYTAKLKVIHSIREDARALYLDREYRLSVVQYTKALHLLSNEGLENLAVNNLHVVLLSNRAAGLLMLGAFDAAVDDCQCALTRVDAAPLGTSLTHDSGPVLKSKLFTRLGRALLKLGEARDADKAFGNAIDTAQKCLELCKQLHSKEEYESSKELLTQAITDATLGKTDVMRYSEVATKIAESDPSLQRTVAAERRNNVELLGHVNIALSTASGCHGLHEKKVSLLANLRRWREVASHCERLASSTVQLDGAFTGDLSEKFPFPGVPAGKMLTASFFNDSNDEDYKSAELKLNSKAAAEAVLRLPLSMTSFYLRALRLEERYPAAELAIQSLETHVNERAENQPHERLRVKFAWLPRERNKLNRTKRGREKGDDLFRAGDFDLAAAQYASCLGIDSEGMENIDGSSSAGGRLHAVLHCNRAACLMALRRFKDAVTECTAALRIHSRYMKAMLRRARCYSRLERYEESVVEYRRWLELVEEARKAPDSAAVFVTPCLFDGPRDVSPDDISQVQKELEEILRLKVKKETAAREEARFRQDRQKFYHEAAFGDAQRRRDNWYSQKGNSGSRRWDSFQGRSPKRSSKTSNRSESWNSDNWRHSQNTGYNQSYSNRNVPNVAHSDPDDHYHVLQVSADASAADIKKSFRKLALKYHPDKNQDPGAGEIFRRVNMAYETLNDASARKDYDKKRMYNYSI